MDLNPAPTSSVANASQENWFHLVVRDNKNGSCPGLPPRYGVFSIDHANTNNMIPLGPDSGLSPQQLVAAEKFSECLNDLEDTGLIIGCCCQLNGRHVANVTGTPVVAGQGGAVNAQRRASGPDNTEPKPSVQSEPLAGPVVSVQGASRSVSDGSTASVNRYQQIVEDYILAHQLHFQLNKSSTDQSLSKQHSSRRASKSEVAASQIGQSGCPSFSLVDRSEPLTGPVVFVQGASRSVSDGSTASVNRYEQIVEDYIFAHQLHFQLNKSSTDQSLSKQHSSRRDSKSEVAASQIGRSSSSLADQSEPLADPVVSLQGAARSTSGSSTASVNRNEQIVKDNIFARQLHDQFNKSSTDQSLLRQHSSTRTSNTEVSASQIGCSSSSLAVRAANNLSPMVWSTGRYYY